MKWKRERDLLVAQTLAFVQSVAGKKDGAKADAANAELRSDVETALIDAIRITAPPDTSHASTTFQAPRNLGISRAVPGEFRAEMQARVANFRAHQERFHRDRDEYYSATFAKLRAAIGNDSASPPPRK
jgi:hypothetical protein